MRSKIETWPKGGGRESCPGTKKWTRSCSSSSTQRDESQGGWSLRTGSRGARWGWKGGWGTEHRGEWGGGFWPSSQEPREEGDWVESNNTRSDVQWKIITQENGEPGPGNWHNENQGSLQRGCSGSRVWHGREQTQRWCERLSQSHRQGAKSVATGLQGGGGGDLKSL